MKFNLKNKAFSELNTSPEKLAIVGADYSLSWQQLKKSTEELKIILQSLNIPKGHPVFIFGNDEPQQIAAMLACMICKFPYVHIELQVPEARISSMKSILNSDVLIHCTRYSGPEFGVSIGLENSEWKLESSKPISFKLQQQDTAYVTFTSGSSGQPKAVLCTWRNIYCYTEYYNSTGIKLSNTDNAINHLLKEPLVSLFKIPEIILFICPQTSKSSMSTPTRST